MSELLSVASPGPDPDSEISLKPNDQSEEPMHCDAGTQVVPERKNARIQTTRRTKTYGIYEGIWVVAVLLFMLTIL